MYIFKDILIYLSLPYLMLASLPFVRNNIALCLAALYMCNVHVHRVHVALFKLCYKCC